MPLVPLSVRRNSLVIPGGQQEGEHGVRFVICNLDFGFLWTLDFFYGLRMTQGYQLDHSLSQRLLKISLLMFPLNLTPCSPSCCPPGMTWDTLLTLRSTKGMYLAHLFDLLDSWTHSCPLSCFSDS